LEELLTRAESHTPKPDEYTSLLELLEDKKASLARLHKLFGTTTEKLRDILPDTSSKICALYQQKRRSAHQNCWMIID
jgi:hypothetical protein